MFEHFYSCFCEYCKRAKTCPNENFSRIYTKWIQQLDKNSNNTNAHKSYIYVHKQDWALTAFVINHYNQHIRMLVGFYLSISRIKASKSIMTQLKAQNDVCMMAYIRSPSWNQRLGVTVWALLQRCPSQQFRSTIDVLDWPIWVDRSPLQKLMVAHPFIISVCPSVLTVDKMIGWIKGNKEDHMVILLL